MKRDRSIPLPLRVRKSLRWWASRENLTKPTQYLHEDPLQLFTDASLEGWGATLNGQMAQGRWSAQESNLHINVLELRAVRLALLFFSADICNHHVPVRMDNTTTKAHLNKQEGTRSSTLHREAVKLFRWAQFKVLSIRAEHIKGALNVEADWLSRQQVNEGEWSLDQDSFRLITQKFGLPEVDLFTSSDNSKLPRFFSRFFHPDAERIDALLSPWPRTLLYAFPPLPIIPKVLRKIQMEKANVLLVAPFWPRRPCASTTAAFDKHSPVDEICRAATWSSVSTFVKHYKISTWSSAQAAFGLSICLLLIDDDFDQFDKPGAERSWRRRAGDDDWDSELDDDLLGEDLLPGKKTPDMSDEELNDDLLQSDNEEDQRFSTQDVSVSLNTTSGMVTSFELSEGANDPSIEQDSEYEQGEDELAYNKSDMPEEYAEEYTEEGQYEGPEAELTEDQIEYGEDQGEEEIYNDEVLDLEINEPLDEFPDEDYMQSYGEQQVMEEQEEYVAEEELGEVADTQTPANESEEAVMDNLELQEEPKEESDEEDDDDEESGRLRFKTERKEGTIIRLSDVTRERRNIPETLELSAEAKAALLEFEERERQHKQGRYGSRRGGRRGGPLMCYGMGEQRRDHERGRLKDHRPALLATQPTVTSHSQRMFPHQQPIRNLFQQQQQQPPLQGLLPIPPQHHTPPPPPQGMHLPPQLETPRILMTPPPATSQQPKNIHINPHFKGTVVTPVQVPLLPVPTQPRPAVGPQRFPGPPDFQQNPPGPVPTNFNQPPRLPLQDQWRGPPPPPPPMPPPPPQDREPFFMGEPRFPSHHLFEQRSPPPPPPPPPLLNSSHPVPGQNPLPFSQPGPGFSQQGQQPVFPRERLVRPNMQPQGHVGVLHFNQPGGGSARQFLPPRQPFLQAPGQPFLATHTQPNIQGPLHPPMQPQHQQHQQPQQHPQHPQPHHQQHQHQHQHQQQHHLLAVPPQPLIPVAPSQFRPHMQTSQQQQSNNRMQCQQRQGLIKPRHNAPAQNIVKRPNQQLQTGAPRNSNLRELPIAPLHAIEAASNRRTSAPAAQVKPIPSATPPVRPATGVKNQQGRSEVKPRAAAPMAQPKAEVKSEPEFPDEDEETRLYRLKIEEQKRLREEILKQKEVRRQLQAGARKRELLERLAQQQQQQSSSTQQQEEEEESSQLPTNGNPLLPLPGAPPRQNVKHRLMVKKPDPVVPNPAPAQPKPTNVLQAEDNVPFQGQQIKTVKQLRQTRTVPESELQLLHKGLQTKPAAAHMNPSQIARVASVQGQPQELKPGVKRTVMQRANSGSGDGPHVGTKVRVIKLSGGGGENVGLSHPEGPPHRFQQPPEQRHQPVRKVTLTKGTIQQPHHPYPHHLAQIHSAVPQGLKNIQGIHQAKKVIMHGRGRGMGGQMGRGRMMPNKQNLRVVECKPQPCVVSVEGLSSSTTDVQLKNLLMSVGPIQSLQMLPQQRKAIAKFKEPADALKFQQKFHRHMIDLSHINVALIVE
uniref:RNA-binding protein 33 n=1 Tax=Euleptes europaea TaxID=460621 RepID=UPI002540779A|nr:RNA-binding protein 33 [Euleptes europaea]